MKYLKGVATLRLDQGRCKGCGMCAEVCPRGVYEIRGGLARITEIDLCIECGACMRNCGHGAISVDAGVGCAAAMIRGLVTGNASCGCGPAEDKSGCC